MILHLAAAVFGLILLAAACIRRPDPRRDHRDEHAQWLGVGGAFFDHQER